LEEKWTKKLESKEEEWKKQMDEKQKEWRRSLKFLEKEEKHVLPQVSHYQVCVMCNRRLVVYVQLLYYG
jgi:hypothetical protein